jgi:hypothetical protein
VFGIGLCIADVIGFGDLFYFLLPVGPLPCLANLERRKAHSTIGLVRAGSQRSEILPVKRLQTGMIRIDHQIEMENCDMINMGRPTIQRIASGMLTI